MYLTLSEVDQLNEESLRSFLAKQLPEGAQLEYKQALPAEFEKREGKVEFLKDITGFANATGGQCFYGVKEPKDGLSVNDQLVGMDLSKPTAQALESLASSSIDPRISGLRIVSVPLASGRVCFIVHIPSSLGRPHMVVSSGHTSFYVRHSESIQKMSAHEVREAVLSSASSEGRARAFVEHRLEKIRTVVGTQPAFFLQAMPLVPPESPIDVFRSEVDRAIRGNARLEGLPYYCNLAGGANPRPTIDGTRVVSGADKVDWQTEFFRNGYACALYNDIQTETVRGKIAPVVHSGTSQIFTAFALMLDELVAATGLDVPYLMTAALLNAKEICLWTGESLRKMGQPYSEQEIIWPEHMRNTAESATVAASMQQVEMFNAFGLRGIVH